MAEDVVIRSEGLGKKYLIGHESSHESYRTLRDAVVRNVQRLGRTAKDMLHGRPMVAGDELEELWALKGVTFEIRRGEVTGVIGANGAGKSTLLKILSRITEPSAGRVTIEGRVASLLEVGTGFHPELTGRENIFLNGAILGMTKREIKAKFDEIVAFAEVEKFLDTPVKRYSSGMYVRLAFAVAAHLEPEILIVDEVLAVGDAQFQSKCLGKMQDVSQDGRTVLIVSHNMTMIRSLCSRAIVLFAGSIASDGTVNDGIQQYLSNRDTAAAGLLLEDRTDRHGDGRLRFTDAYVIGNSGVKNVLYMGETAQIVVTFSTTETVKKCDLSIHLENVWTDTILRLATRETAAPFNDLSGRGAITCTIPKLQLLPGKYYVLVAASIPPAYEYLDYVSHAAVFEVLEDDVYGSGKIPDCGAFYTECEWRADSVI
ncbi:MAG: ABC transporter ATP-binding protein [Candidatus Acidiferrales bacterium]